EGKGYSPHKLRHSYATLLLQNGADLISIKELLGHEDLNSTKVVF
ncbi:MAG: tyrosine-type recombinase/integrase, partial [Dethiobacter sp.]|nr:tyrosine-type recombinase/integrase [Dethiobacter sp.]